MKKVFSFLVCILLGIQFFIMPSGAFALTGFPVSSPLIKPLITNVLTPNTGQVLSATAGDGYVELSWPNATYANAANFVGFNLYRGTAPGKEEPSPVTDFPITGTSHKDLNVENGTTYYYILKPSYKDHTDGPPYNEVSATPSAQGGTIVLTISNPNMLVNGVSKPIDPGFNTVPVMNNGRTFIPIRTVVETMGGSVAWNATEHKVTISLNNKTIEIWIGNKNAKVNGVVKVSDVAPYISSTNRTMLPLRFISENLGCAVTWDGPTKMITIKYTPPQSGDSASQNTPVTGVSQTQTNNLKVAGFPVTNFQGTVSNDGSFQGSGKLTLPGGNTVNATFSVNAQGHVVSGSWNGAVNLYGWHFNVASGKIDDSGINGVTDFKLAGSQTQLRIVLNSAGSLTSAYSGSLKIGQWNFTNVSLNLNNSNMSGSGNVSILGSNVKFSLNVNSSGTVTGTARTSLTSNLPGAKLVSIPDVSLTLSPSGSISGTGKINAGNVGIADASVNINPNGTVSGKGSVSVGPGKITSDYILGPSTFIVTGTNSLSPIKIPVPIPNPLLIPPMITVDLTFSGSVSLSVKNVNEIVATATGLVEGPFGTKVSVSQSVNLLTGKITVDVLGVKVDFKLF